MELAFTVSAYEVKFDFASFPLEASVTLPSRKAVLRSRGIAKGPVTRLAGPADIGERLKPFVLFDHATVNAEDRSLLGLHAHSGVATVTLVLEGSMVYEDSTGMKGELEEGGVEWIRSGNGLWHSSGFLTGQAGRLFEIWIALPPGDESAVSKSLYLGPKKVRSEGPARVILGRLGRTQSVIEDTNINLFHVRLKRGQHWDYQPPADHDIVWLAVDKGRLKSDRVIETRQLAVFDDSNDGVIAVEALSDTSFLVGSSARHSYPLVRGYYSLHTNRQALARAEDELRHIGRRLRAEGRI